MKPRLRHLLLTRVGALLVLALLAVPLAGWAQEAPPPRQHDVVPNLLDHAYVPFSSQHVEWSTAACSGRDVPRQPSYECATVVAPLDWSRPTVGTVRLALYRTVVAPADPPASRLLLANPGGPGADSHLYAQMAVDLLGLGATHRAVDMDARGTGASTPARCESPDLSIDRDIRRDLADLSREQMIDFGRRLSSALRACAEAPGSVLPWITTMQTAQDLNLVRHLLGYPKADFFGNSYGTWVGAVLGRMYPDAFERLLFNATVDTSSWSFDHIFDDVFTGVQESFDLTYVPWLSRHDHLFHLGTTSRAVHTKLGELREGLRQRAKSTTVFDTLLMQAQVEGPRAFEGHTRAVLSYARDGVHVRPARVSGEGRFAPPSYPLLPLIPTTDDAGLQPVRPGSSALVASITPLMAVRCGDVHSSRTLEEGADEAIAALTTHPLTAKQHLIHMACAQWPQSSSVSEVIREAPLTGVLMTHNEDDPNAPYRGAAATHVDLFRDSRLVVLDDGHGHGQGLFDPCLTSFASGFLRTGVLPAQRYCQAGPLPLERVVYEHGAPASPVLPLPSVLTWPQRMLNFSPAIDQESTRRWQWGNPAATG